MALGTLGAQWVAVKGAWAGYGEVHCHILALVPCHEEDVCRAVSVGRRNLLGMGNVGSNQRLGPYIPQGVVPSGWPVLAARDEVVTIGIKGLVTQRAAREGNTFREERQTEPEPAEAREFGVWQKWYGWHGWG